MRVLATILYAFKLAKVWKCHVSKYEINSAGKDKRQRSQQRRSLRPSPQREEQERDRVRLSACVWVCAERLCAAAAAVVDML